MTLVNVDVIRLAKRPTGVVEVLGQIGQLGEILEIFERRAPASAVEIADEGWPVDRREDHCARPPDGGVVGRVAGKLGEGAGTWRM